MPGCACGLGAVSLVIKILSIQKICHSWTSSIGITHNKPPESQFELKTAPSPPITGCVYMGTFEELWSKFVISPQPSKELAYHAEVVMLDRTVSDDSGLLSTY